MGISAFLGTNSTLLRLRRPRSVEQVLKQLYPRQSVDSALRSALPCDLIQRFAEHSSTSIEELLGVVAGTLELQGTLDLTTPSPELISETGHSVEVLRELNAIPQLAPAAPAGYKLVVGDPLLIDMPEFWKRGVPILLSTGSAIRACWESYDRKHFPILSVTIDQALAVINQLAIDASSLGATQVFVGHPKGDTYTFSAQGKHYGGTIHQQIPSLLISTLSAAGRLVQPCSKGTLNEITLALTKEFEHPAICLTWGAVTLDVSASPVSVSSAITELTTSEDIENRSLEASCSDLSGHQRSPDSDCSTKIPGDLIKSRTVLVIDDDPRFVAVLGKILESRNWIVCSGNTGRQALELLEKGTVAPDLIICDIHMPQMDGGEFVASLRAAQIEIPVLMLTSDEEVVLEAELVMLGADAFLRKGEDLRILIAWCNNLTSRHRARPPAWPAQSSCKPPGSTNGRVSHKNNNSIADKELSC